MTQTPNPSNFASIEPQRYKGILLDLDDTLYAYQPAHKAGQAAMLSFLAKETGVSQALLESYYSDARQLVHHRLLGQAASHSRLLYAQGIVEKAMGRSVPTLILAAEEIYWTTFLEKAQVFEEAWDFLRACEKYNVPICLVTDLTAQIQFKKIAYWKLDKYIQWVVTSEEAGVEKPHPSMFQMALAKLNILPQEALMIGDSAKKDMAGAKVLGISTQQI